jgi:hypothetical protein
MYKINLKKENEINKSFFIPQKNLISTKKFQAALTRTSLRVCGRDDGG